MTTLPTKTGDALFISGIAISAIACLAFGHFILSEFNQRQQTAAVKQSISRSGAVSQAAEDALKHTTLKKLLDSHNYDIRETASRIVLDRSLHDTTVINELLAEVVEASPARREKGIQALLLVSRHSRDICELNRAKVYLALVKCLQLHAATAVYEIYDKDFDDFEFRDPLEKQTLVLIARIVKEFGPRGFIKAGLIERWLTKQRWGLKPVEIQDNFTHAIHRGGTLASIIGQIERDTTGRRQLVSSRLVPVRMDVVNDTIDVRMTNGEGTAGEAGLASEGDLRLRDLSPEEANLRRRHRMAMVLNDGTQPIARSDIIEREPSTQANEGQMIG